MLLRGYKREATAILQKDPDILRSIVQVPASSIANIMARAKDNVARQLAALVNFQTSPDSLTCCATKRQQVRAPHRKLLTKVHVGLKGHWGYEKNWE